MLARWRRDRAGNASHVAQTVGHGGGGAIETRTRVCARSPCLATLKRHHQHEHAVQCHCSLCWTFWCPANWRRAHAEGCHLRRPAPNSPEHPFANPVTGSSRRSWSRTRQRSWTRSTCSRISTTPISSTSGTTLSRATSAYLLRGWKRPSCVGCGGGAQGLTCQILHRVRAGYWRRAL